MIVKTKRTDKQSLWLHHECYLCLQFISSPEQKAHISFYDENSPIAYCCIIVVSFSLSSSEPLVSTKILTKHGWQAKQKPICNLCYNLANIF